MPTSTASSNASSRAKEKRCSSDTPTPRPQSNRKALAGLKAIEPEDLTTLDLIRFWDVAVRIERVARGIPEADDSMKAPFEALWLRLQGTASAHRLERTAGRHQPQ